MKRIKHFAFVAATQLALLVGSATNVLGQINDDWVVFQDTTTDMTCDVVNAANAELIVLYDTGVMVVVSGPDVAIEELVVDELNQVFYDGTLAGYIEIAEDGDGLPTVFWTTLTGTLLEINTLTGEPSDSGVMPNERTSTGCDACDYIEQSVHCDSNDSDTQNGNSETPAICGSGAFDTILASMILLPILGLIKNARA